MHPSVALNLAAELLRRVLLFAAPADGTVAAFFREHHELGPRERRAMADTIYSVLRNRRVFEHLAGGGPGPLERRLAILGWPPGAASDLERGLDDAERAWRSTAMAVDHASLPQALTLELPDWLAESLRGQVGEELPTLAESLLRPAPLDLRVNTMKAKRDAVQRELAALDVATLPTPLSPWGLRVEGKPAIERLAPAQRGEFEVQDEGSQLLALLVGARRGETVVDFCAGAGGKTLALGVAMRGTGRLMAFDTSAHRLEGLKPRLLRSGLANVYPMQIAHERDERLARWTGKVDRVLVDAPCTGLGTLRRHPDLKWRQTLAVVAEMQALQAQILASAARLVRPGGRLVYATCSLLSEENEAVAAAFGAAQPAFKPLSVASLLQTAGLPEETATRLALAGTLRLWPHRHDTDGFFAAVWQRD